MIQSVTDNHLFHRFFSHWDDNRGNEFVPLKTDIPIAGIADLAHDLCILGISGTNDVSFRYVGQNIGDRTDTNLTGGDLLPHFPAGARERLKLAIDIMFETPSGMFMHYDAIYGCGGTAEIECLALPMVQSEDRQERLVLALVQPLTRSFGDAIDSMLAFGSQFLDLRAVDIGAGLPLEPAICTA